MASMQYSSVVGAGKGWTTVRTPSGQTVKISGTRSTRNNNPGNIEYGNFARSQGAIGSDGRFAVFPSRETGFRAMQGLVFNGRYADLSLSQAIERYAPAFENNPAAYAAAVAKKAGVALTTKMKDIPAELRGMVTQAMAGVEGMGHAIVRDLEGNVIGRINPAREQQNLPDTPPLPPQRYQTIAAQTAPVTPETMRAAVNLAALPAGGVIPSVPQTYSAPIGQVDRSPLAPVAPTLPSRPVTPTPQAAIAALTRPSAPMAMPSRPVSPTPAQAMPSPPSMLTSPKPMGDLQFMTQRAPIDTYVPYAAPTPPPTPTPVAQPARPTTPTPPAALAATTGMAALTDPNQTAATQTFTPQAPQPTFVPNAPAPVAPAVPVAPPVAPPTIQRLAAPSQGFPSAPPTPPRATAMDVYSGRANQGYANDGSMVSRDAYGNTSVSNKYGATTTMHPNGLASVSYGPRAPSLSSFPSAPGAISGPLSAPGIPSPPSTGFMGISPAQTETGKIGRNIAGSFAGGAIGSLLGPIGSLVGAALGQSIAQGKNPLDALSRPQTTPGLSLNSFPTAPTRAGALGGTQSNNSRSGMNSISPGAASAISKGQGGLY